MRASDRLEVCVRAKSAPGEVYLLLTSTYHSTYHGGPPRRGLLLGVGWREPTCLPELRYSIMAHCRSLLRSTECEMVQVARGIERMKTGKATNQEAYQCYRARVEHLDSPVPDCSQIDPWFPTRIVLFWAARYGCRRNFLQGEGLDGGWILRDQPARNLLIARNCARDAAVVDLPDWAPDELTHANSCLKRLGRLGLSSLADICGAGPSVRWLWAEAKSSGLSGLDAFQNIVKWVSQRPASWQRDDERKKRRQRSPDAKLRAHLDTHATWNTTGDSHVPWIANVAGQVWSVRINDFPDEWMYSLLIDNQAVGDFHDWPGCWNRGDSQSSEAHDRVVAQPRRLVASGNLLTRYQHGEHEQVWADLTALGEDVRSPKYRDEARAVARETMKRTKANIALLANRLEALGYRFRSRGHATSPAASSDRVRASAESLRERKPPQGASLDPRQLAHWQESAARIDPNLVPEFAERGAALRQRRMSKRLEGPPPEATDGRISPLTSEAARLLRSLETRGCVFPLSLRAWLDEVGSADLLGSHPTLCPLQDGEDTPAVCADPLAISVALNIVAMDFEDAKEDEGCGPVECLLSHGPRGKTAIAKEIAESQESPDRYVVYLPDANADCTLHGATRLMTLVEHLRLSFRWGGFPGWESQADRPEKELALLREGMIPI
jgi:hypothetical protein